MFENPWSSDGWSKHVKTEVIKYWTKLLKESAASYPSLEMVDINHLKLTSPHAIWKEAGSNPVSVTKTTVVTWLLLGVYKTGERLHKMKKVRTPQCLVCFSPLEDQLHFALQCSGLIEIRTQYMNKFVEACPNIAYYQSDLKLLLLALLDPFSTFLPDNIKESWTKPEIAYELSRNYFYDLHKKREKLIEATLTKQTQPEIEDETQIIISVYEHI